MGRAIGALSNAEISVTPDILPVQAIQVSVSGYKWEVVPTVSAVSKLRARLNFMSNGTLLIVQDVTVGLEIKKSNILHPNAGFNGISAMLVGRGSVNEKYCEVLNY